MLKIWIQSLMVLFLNGFAVALAKRVLAKAWHGKPWELWRVTLRCQMRAVRLEVSARFGGICDLMSLGVSEIWLFRRIGLHFLHANQRHLAIISNSLIEWSGLYCTCMILSGVCSRSSEVLLETSLIEMLGSGSGISGGQAMEHAPQIYALRMVGSDTFTKRLV